jgi:hypothetical protein
MASCILQDGCVRLLNLAVPGDREGEGAELLFGPDHFSS